MSFHEAEAAEASAAGLATLLRDSLREPSYVRNVDQVFENMDTDPLIGAAPLAGQPASRVELLQTVAPHRMDPSCLREEADLFCRRHQREGPPFPDAANTTFGRVCTFEAVVNGIAAPNSPLDLKDARALLRNAIDAPPSPLRLARQRADLDSKNLSLFQMWSFPVADPASPLVEIGPARGEALDILGLGGIDPTKEIVAFAHRLPAGTPAHRPTAWDAGRFACWRTGGLTYRLDRDEYHGLREVVHNRIKGEHLAATIDTLP
jgi:hypothetical protein